MSRGRVEPVAQRSSLLESTWIGELLESKVTRLSRLAYSMIWMSPLTADPAYRPLTRGMRLAHPHLDHLVPADSLGDLEAVAQLLPRLVSGTRTR